MLTTVLDRLTSLGSKHFVIGAFVPVLVFGFVNGVLLYLEFDWFHQWANPQLSGASRAFDVAAVAVGLAVVAYVVWSLNSFLIAVLEGKLVRSDSGLVRKLRTAQLERFRNLRKNYFNARDAAAQVARGTAKWKADLTGAASEGLSTKDAAGAVIDNPNHTYDGTTGPAPQALSRLRQLRVQASEIPIADLQQAVDWLCQVLRVDNIRIPNPATGVNVLSDDRRDLLTLFDYAQDRWSAREVSLANELQWRFGVRDVAPTAFGNVAAALESYGLTRYGLNLPTFWSRMQAVLQKEEAFFGMLQDAKSQLDFLVSSCWLAALTTAVWGVVLPMWGDSAWRFVATMTAGPVVARMCYVAAVENYVAFAEIVRASVDLHRFRLLDELHLPRPTSLRDERRLWEALQRVTAYGQEWVDIGYQHQPRAKT